MNRQEAIEKICEMADELYEDFPMNYYIMDAYSAILALGVSESEIPDEFNEKAKAKAKEQSASVNPCVPHESSAIYANWTGDIDPDTAKIFSSLHQPTNQEQPQTPDQPAAPAD